MKISKFMWCCLHLPTYAPSLSSPAGILCCGNARRDWQMLVAADRGGGNDSKADETCWCLLVVELFLSSKHSSLSWGLCVGGRKTKGLLFLSFFHSPPLKRKRETGFSPPFNTRRIDPPPPSLPGTLPLLSQSAGRGVVVGEGSLPFAQQKATNPRPTPAPFLNLLFSSYTRGKKHFSFPARGAQPRQASKTFPPSPSMAYVPAQLSILSRLSSLIKQKKIIHRCSIAAEVATLEQGRNFPRLFH